MADDRHGEGSGDPMAPSGDAARVSPPIVDAPTELPFRGLTWAKFERLCQDIASAHGFTDVHRYGKPGQPQDGIDFVGVSPEGQRTAFQVRQTATVSAMELREAVQRYAAGALAARTDAFIVCMAVEGNERSLQDKLAQLKEQYEFPIRLWDAAELTHLLRDEESLVRKFFGPYWAEVYFGPPASPRRRLDADALLLGPVEALNLKPKVEKAQRLAGTSPMSAAKLYEEIADVLHTRFPDMPVASNGCAPRP